MFLRRETYIRDSLCRQKGLLAQANERLAQKSTDATDLWTLCAWLKEEATSAQREADPLAERVHRLEGDQF
jgi:hypothetical protein